MIKQKHTLSVIAAFSILCLTVLVFSQTPNTKIFSGDDISKKVSSSFLVETPPVGNYPCYYFGYNYALTSSSLTEISILPKQRMKIVGELVPFRLDGSTLTLEDGEFAGATAHLKTSDGKPAIVFIRKENEPKGHKIDVSDTWRYFEK